MKTKTDARKAAGCAALCSNFSQKAIHRLDTAKSRRKSFGKWMLPLLAVLFVFLRGAGTAAAAQNAFEITQHSFESPTAAAAFFTDAIAQNDLAAALSAFAFSERAEKYDFKAQVDRLQMFSPAVMSAPDYEAYEPLNKIMMLNQAATALKLFIYSFHYEEDLGKPNTLSGSDVTAADIYAQLDPQKLNGLKLVRLDYVRPEVQDSEPNQNVNQRNEAIYGSTGTEDYFALYELDGAYYYGGFQFGKYADGWQINLLNSPIGGISPFGSVTETTEADYLKMIE